VFIVGPNERRKRTWCRPACAERARWAKKSPGPRPKAEPYAPFHKVWYGTCEVCGQLWCGQKTNRKPTACAREDCRKEAKNRRAREAYAADPDKGRARVALTRATRTEEERARESERVKAWWAQFPEAMCAVCGKPTGKPVRMDRARVCSNACRSTLQTRARPPKPPKPPKIEWVPVPRSCARCDAPFIAVAENHTYCTRKCGRRARGERRDLALRMTSVGKVERVVRRAIFERDGWVCQLCDYPTNPDVTVPDFEAPTIDHIIPLAWGGDHTPANVQTAHFLCNSYKRDLV
jgi:hypothetical protein